jgi:hypothetical protein
VTQAVAVQGQQRRFGGGEQTRQQNQPDQRRDQQRQG